MGHTFIPAVFSKSCLTLCDPMDCSTPDFSVLHYLSPGGCSNSCLLSRWSHPTVSSSVSSCPQSFLSSDSSKSWLCPSVGQGIGASASASVLPMNIQGWFPIDWLVWSSCCPRDSQESSPALEFKSINSLALSLLYVPNLTSTHDYWKNHSFDNMDLCQQNDASAF